MTSALPCLVDATLLIEVARCSTLDVLGGDCKVAVGELMLASVTHWRDDARAAHRIDLGAFVESRRIEVMRATAVEVGGVMRWVGRGGLSEGELESVAIALAGRGRLYTRDRVVARVLEELGIQDRLVGFGAARLPSSCTSAGSGGEGPGT